MASSEVPVPAAAAAADATTSAMVMPSASEILRALAVAHPEPQQEGVIPRGRESVLPVEMVGTFVAREPHFIHCLMRMRIDGTEFGMTGELRGNRTSGQVMVHRNNSTTPILRHMFIQVCRLLLSKVAPLQLKMTSSTDDAFIQPESMCPICLVDVGTLNASVPVCRTPCCHTPYCMHCLQRWVEQERAPACPSCRASLNETSSCMLLRKQPGARRSARIRNQKRKRDNNEEETA